MEYKPLYDVKALVWTTNSNSQKSKRYPAEEGTSGLSFIYGNVHFWSYFSERELSRHSGACCLSVSPFYCKTHKVASSRKFTQGDDRPVKYPTSYRHMLTRPMIEVNIPRNKSFPGNADLWAVKALVWSTNATASPTPESRKGTQPKRLPAACLFYTIMCFFGHICPLISRHSGACGLKVSTISCKTH